MSASDPKRTFGTEFCCDAQDALVVFSYGPEFIDGNVDLRSLAHLDNRNKNTDPA